MKIGSPEDRLLRNLCDELAILAVESDRQGAWPAQQLEQCASHGVFEWFLEPQFGGQDWSSLDVARGYLALSQSCLTTTFVLTQRTGACRRIAGSQNLPLKEELLPRLATGELFATVGISHLTTSRQHLDKPPLAAYQDGDDWILDGYSPWVTGALHADYVVVGATLCEGEIPTEKQILIVLPTNAPGVRAEKPFPLVALTGSHTGALKISQVKVDQHYLLAGPVENVMTSGIGATTGGYETSTLAIGLASAAIRFLQKQVPSRPNLTDPTVALANDLQQLEQRLLAAIEGSDSCTRESLRQQANSLALRATQSALSAAKGAGFVEPHQVGRWCKEALFFLVWSCPQAVVDANLCQLAGIES